MQDETEVYPFQRSLKVREKRQSKFKGRKERKGRKEAYEEYAKTEKAAERKDESPVNKFKVSIAGRQLLFCLLGFFLGRAVLLGELSPFAAAFTGAVTWVFPSSGIAAVIGVGAGLAAAGKNIHFAATCAAVVLVWVFVAYLPADTKKHWLIIPGIVLALTLILKAVYFAFVDFSSYDYISTVFEAVFAGALTVIFLHALASFSKIGSLQNLSPEEVFCVLALVACIIAGTGGLQFWEVSFQGLLSRLVILTLALVGGMGQGAAAGALMGIIPGLAYVAVPLVIGGYSFAGLMAGICRGLGKPGVATGFLLGNIFLFIYIQNFDHFVSEIIGTCIAVLFFFLIPTQFIERLAESCTYMIPGGAAGISRGSKVQELVNGIFSKWSGTFKELSLDYAQACASVQDLRQEPTLQAFFNEIGQKVCNGCGVYHICWEREFYLTYQSLLNVFTQVETCGQVTVSDLPETLKRRCTRARELAVTIACLYDAYKLNCYWTRRMMESKEIVSDQLKSISEIIEDLSSQFQFEVEENNGKETYFKKKLKNLEIPIVEIKLIRQEKGGKEVTLSRQPCPDFLDCHTRAVPAIAQLLKEPLSLPAVNCCSAPKNGLCFIRLYPSLKYQLNIGMAKTGKGGSDVSGDSYSFMHLKGGEFAFALSDGMGAGLQAARESSTALSLLKHLLESGLARELAVKTVNSLMMLRFPGDSFATVDMVTLNLYSGLAEFIKIGAPPSFIKRDGRVRLIRANSLPVGIIKDIEVTKVTKKLVSGDLLVMVSDGMLDSYRGARGKEDWLKEILQETGDIEPRELADLLLQTAQTVAGGAGQISDDITVLVARLEKKEGL